ncbi:hypothetical protein ACJX0J_006150, partial [Zea mays]
MHAILIFPFFLLEPSVLFNIVSALQLYLWRMSPRNPHSFDLHWGQGMKGQTKKKQMACMSPIAADEGPEKKAFSSPLGKTFLQLAWGRENRKYRLKEKRKEIKLTHAGAGVKYSENVKDIIIDSMHNSEVIQFINIKMDYPGFTLLHWYVFVMRTRFDAILQSKHRDLFLGAELQIAWIALFICLRKCLFIQCYVAHFGGGGGGGGGGGERVG